MDLQFKTNKLKKQCEDYRIAQRELGVNIGKKLTQRINELRAAETLDDIAKNSNANGFHELKGDRSNKYAVYLVHPFRLVFKAVTDNDGNEYLDINSVILEEVGDYHGKNNRKK
ncbi:MAG: type II toxin-antitoxin system RelE/ParE family toxin [Clostridium neonatale]